jgi:hypothetical protein
VRNIVQNAVLQRFSNIKGDILKSGDVLQAFDWLACDWLAFDSHALDCHAFDCPTSRNDRGLVDIADPLTGSKENR